MLLSKIRIYLAYPNRISLLPLRHTFSSILIACFDSKDSESGQTSQNRPGKPDHFKSFPYHPHLQDHIEDHKIFPYSAAWSTNHMLPVQLFDLNWDTKRPGTFCPDRLISIP